MGEIDRTARKLKNKLGDDEAWFFTWQELGDELKQKADDCRDRGHTISASVFYLRASCYYQWGERFRTVKDDHALNVYRKSVECFHEHAQKYFPQNRDCRSSL